MQRNETFSLYVKLKVMCCQVDCVQQNRNKWNKLLIIVIAQNEKRNNKIMQWICTETYRFRPDFATWNFRSQS